MQSIFSFFQELINHFNAYAKEYPFVAGTLSLWGLGVLSYLCRGIPREVFNIIKKYTTTTVTLQSSSESFHLFLKWYQNKGFAKRGRYIKISNGRWGSSDMIKSLGYGNHYFWYKWKMIQLEMVTKEVAGTDKERDEITMVKLGRSHKIFDDIFSQIKEEDLDKNKLILKKFIKGWWHRSSEQMPRSMDTIFLRKGVKERLLDTLRVFLERENWYVNNGIPYQLGIMLYGPAGTGKSSIIKAIANHIRYSLHILQSGSLSDIENAMFSLSEKAMISIEDIDTEAATKVRKPIQQVQESGLVPQDIPLDPEDEVLSFSFSNLSDILNSIDGVHSIHGRILVTTTNHIEKLDPALLRPGRIDLQLEIGYADEYVLKQFFDKFYPDFIIPENFIMKSHISSAIIQNLILENMNDPASIIKELEVMYAI